MSDINLTRVRRLIQKKSNSVYAEALTYNQLVEDNKLATLPGDILLNLSALYVLDPFVSAGPVTADLGTTQGGSDLLSGLDLTVAGLAGLVEPFTSLDHPEIHLTITAPSAITAGELTPLLNYTEYKKHDGTYTESDQLPRYDGGWILDNGFWNCDGYWTCKGDEVWRCN